MENEERAEEAQEWSVPDLTYGQTAEDEMLADPHVKRVNADAIEKTQMTGGKVYFKWTCGSCGERATCGKPNSLYCAFTHEDCGYTTKTIDGDLGFALIFPTGGFGTERR